MVQLTFAVTAVTSSIEYYNRLLVYTLSNRMPSNYAANRHTLDHSAALCFTATTTLPRPTRFRGQIHMEDCLEKSSRVPETYYIYGRAITTHNPPSPLSSTHDSLVLDLGQTEDQDGERQHCSCQAPPHFSTSADSIIASGIVLVQDLESGKCQLVYCSSSQPHHT